MARTPQLPRPRQPPGETHTEQLERTLREMPADAIVLVPQWALRHMIHLSRRLDKLERSRP